MNINRVLLIGNLTVQPQLVEAGKTKIVNASLANHQFFENGQEERQDVTTFCRNQNLGCFGGEFR